uniref:ZFAND2A/B-like C2H2 zinc finger domain-containing protein n=1 Tax=Timema monikensis TaxID=170555 RepID=A0A7R9DYD4_9NEOP|nr:unnamed protein product [Timema monikensis]
MAADRKVVAINYKMLETTGINKEHMVYSCHNCPSACQKDVQVPLCPLCNTPVLVGPGEQPDKVVGEHIEQDCQAISAIDRRKNDSANCVLRDNLKQANLSSLVEVSTAAHLQDHTKFHNDSRLIVQDILETAIKSMLDNVTEASFCDTNAVPVQQNTKVCSTNVCSPQNIEENVKSQQPVPKVVSEVGSEALPNCSLGSFELPDNVKSKKDSGKSNSITKENETDSSFLGKKKIEDKDIFNLMCHVNLANEDNMLLSVEENTGSVLRPLKEIKFDIDKTEAKQLGLNCLRANRPVSRLTLPFHIGSNTDAKSNGLIGQESALKSPTPLKDHRCVSQLPCSAINTLHDA